jgi:hypothetical protein
MKIPCTLLRQSHRFLIIRHAYRPASKLKYFERDVSCEFVWAFLGRRVAAEYSELPSHLLKTFLL